MQGDKNGTFFLKKNHNFASYDADGILEWGFMGRKGKEVKFGIVPKNLQGKECSVVGTALFPSLNRYCFQITLNLLGRLAL